MIKAELESLLATSKINSSVLRKLSSKSWSLCQPWILIKETQDSITSVCRRKKYVFLGFQSLAYSTWSASAGFQKLGSTNGCRCLGPLSSPLRSPHRWAGAIPTPFLKTERLELLPKHPPGPASQPLFMWRSREQGAARAPPRAPLVLSFRGKTGRVS